jgi:hypothetical protein
MKFIKIVFTVVIILLVVALIYPNTEVKSVTNGEIIKISNNDTAGWSWHQRPLAVHYKGEKDKTYIGTITNTGDVQITSYNHESKEMKKNTLDTFDGAQGGGDDHSSPALLIRNSDKRIIVFWTGHSSKTIYYAISKEPEDISLFGATREISNPTGDYSYVQPIELTAENKIYLFTRRNYEKDPSIRVWDINVSVDNGNSFIRENPLWFEKDTNAPYAEVSSNGIDTIYFLRSDWMRDKPSYIRKYLTFCYYKDGALYKADGSKIINYSRLPIKDRTKLDLIYDSDFEGDTGYVFSKDVGVDDIGNPVAVYTTMDKENINHYWYAKWNGEEWIKSYIVQAGYTVASVKTQPAYDAGIALNYDNVNELSLSREIPLGSGNFEIEKWITLDNGLTWELDEEITNSYEFLDDKQFRPYVPLNSHPELDVLWVGGPTYETYNNFETYLYGRFMD